MFKKTLLIMFAALALSGCADHSRNFYQYNCAEDKGKNTVNTTVSLEKKGTTEESVVTPSTEGTLEIPVIQ